MPQPLQNGLKQLVVPPSTGGGGPSANASLFTIPVLHYWTVPDGVSLVSMVCIGGGGSYYSSGSDSYVKRGGDYLCRGPYGGASNTSYGFGDVIRLSPGNGVAATYSDDSVDVNVIDWPTANNSLNRYQGTSLLGEDADHNVTRFYGNFNYVSNTSAYVGGRQGGGGRVNGAGLAYSNNVSVVPGEALSVKAGLGSHGGAYSGGDGGVLICWGVGSFPQLDTQDLTFKSGGLI